MVFALTPGTGTILQSWTFQPVAVVLALAALWWYRTRVRALTRPWRTRRTGSFVGGLVLILLLTCGPAAEYGRTVYWVWTTQSLALLLVAPLPLMCGQPIVLSRLNAGGPGVLARLVDSRFGRALSSPLVGPALIPVACLVTLFGVVPGWVAQSQPAGWLAQLLLVVVGAMIVLPLVTEGDRSSSVAVGAAVMVGFFELLIDAVPGLVLRLETKPVSGFFAHRASAAYAPGWLHDQQIGGGILWCVAELLDLPYLGLVFLRWIRADAREAAEVDAALDRASLAPRPAERATDPDAAPEPEQPWFLSDPRLRDRLR